MNFFTQSRKAAKKNLYFRGIPPKGEGAYITKTVESNFLKPGTSDISLQMVNNTVNTILY